MSDLSLGPDPTPVPAAPTPRTPAQKAAIHGRNAVVAYPDEDRTPALTAPTAMACLTPDDPALPADPEPYGDGSGR